MNFFKGTQSTSWKTFQNSDCLRLSFIENVYRSFFFWSEGCNIIFNLRRKYPIPPSPSHMQPVVSLSLGSGPLLCLPGFQAYWLQRWKAGIRRLQSNWLSLFLKGLLILRVGLERCSISSWVIYQVLLNILFHIQCQLQSQR